MSLALVGPDDVVVAKATLQRDGTPLAHYRARWDAVLAAYSIEACRNGENYRAIYLGGDEERLRAFARMFDAAADAAGEYGCNAPGEGPRWIDVAPPCCGVMLPGLTCQTCGLTRKR